VRPRDGKQVLHAVFITEDVSAYDFSYVCVVGRKVISHSLLVNGAEEQFESKSSLPASHLRMIRPFWRRSTVLFVVLSLTLTAIKLLLDVALTDLPLRDQTAAFTWTLVLAIIAIGFAGLLADRASGFPDPLTESARDWRGIRLAVITGAIYGLITIGMYIWHPVSSPLNTGSGWDHVRLPWSIPFYTFGAIFLEYLLRLGALCVGFWVIHVLIARRHSVAGVLGFEFDRRALRDWALSGARYPRGAVEQHRAHSSGATLSLECV
jgi:hypothetical protein